MPPKRLTERVSWVPFDTVSTSPALQDGIRCVAQGVYFTLPEALPRGRHNLTREQVIGAQRERILAAMTELLAARGYRHFGPGDVVRRAGVSLHAFYASFENKDACVFAGYDRFIEVLLGRMTVVDVRGLEPGQIVHSLLAAWLATLQADTVVARAYTVEIDALGIESRERRRHALGLFASYIRQLASERGVDLPEAAYIGIVYAARQLAADALDTEDEPKLNALADELEAWLLDTFRDR
jgi:AcrR family transcriptional regulator